MVLDFIDKYNGYLQLTDEKYARAMESDPTIRTHDNCSSTEIQKVETDIEYKFMAQLKEVVKIADVKYLDGKSFGF